AAKWAWDNKTTVLKWIRDGLAVDYIIDKIKNIVY
ncbi:hypothetical protein J2W44_005625, partial [Priestia aryabhattai]